jgi:uncharacterized membrane protein YdjX (TVP38/TMEM64 family)
MNKNLVFRILLLFLLIALGVFLFVHFDLVQFFKDKNKIITFIKSYPYDEVVFILLQIVQVIAAPIPGELSGFIGGYLYGPFWGTLYSRFEDHHRLLAGFILAHVFGEPLLEKKVSKKRFLKSSTISWNTGACSFPSSCS